MHTGRRKRVLISIVAILALLGLGGFQVFKMTQEKAPEIIRGSGGAQSNETPDAGEGGETSSPSDTNSRRITVYLDGWSHSTLDKVKVTATPDAEGAKGQTVTWSPLNAQDIKELAQSDPDIIKRVAGRLFTTNKDLTCDNDSCTSAAGELTYEQLAEPSEIPGLGASYADYEVERGIWSARLSLPEGVGSVTLSAPEWNNATLIYSSNTATDGADTADGEGADAVTPVAENGYLKATYPLSAGLGSFFVTSPSWLDSEPSVQLRRGALGTDLSVETVKEQLSGPLFAEGLATPSVLSDGLSPSQLTYMTSPTTGCGIGVLCAPTTVENSVEGFSVDATTVCNVESGQKAILTSESSLWNFTLPGRTSIHGAWDGQSPEDWGGEGESVVYTGQAPLIEGKQTLRESIVRLFDGQGVVTQFATAGSVGQDGFDSDEAMNRTFDVTNVSDYFNGEYEAC